MAEVLLGLDVGEARIGVAVAEVGRPFAFGRGVIEARDSDQAVADVVRRAEQEGAGTVVVGLPKRSDGTDSRQTRRVRAFARALEAAGLRVVLEDERFTTQLAARQVRGAGLPRGKRQEKGRLDEASARLILETYLERRSAGGGPEADRGGPAGAVEPESGLGASGAGDGDGPEGAADRAERSEE